MSFWDDAADWLKAEIAKGDCHYKYPNGDVVHFTPEGDYKVTKDGVEFRSIEDIKAGRGF